jgi:thiol:disulfide interchange protein DsbD
MGWGLITILTPCVFPLLPVTVSFFSKQKGPALPRSTVYALGIVFTLTVIGLVFKSTLDVFARGSAFNLFVGFLFFALALSLFGMFELRLPGFLIDKAQEKSGSGGLIGPFFMAVVLALTSFSCSVPFLAIMFSQFDKGRVVASVLGLVAYSSTVALPFFLCSLFPALLKTLPKSGGWLNAVKVTMGFVEFGLAFKFLRTVAINNGSDVLPRSLVLAIWVACAIGATLYLFGYVVLPHDTKVESIGVVRLLFAILFLTLALYFVPGMFGRPLNAQLEGFIQSEEKDFAGATTGSRGAGESKSEIAWTLNDWDGALARAAEKKRPALFDFTGVG